MIHFNCSPSGEQIMEIAYRWEKCLQSPRQNVIVNVVLHNSTTNSQILKGAKQGGYKIHWGSQVLI